MTPNKQVSPVIRISQRERDASARATHLKAATRKFLVTTNERKQMSTKTYFKRIALVAVTALGLGVLSTVPASANVVVSSITSSSAAGTSGQVQGALGQDSATAATLTVSFQGTLTTDTMAVTIVPKSKPTSAALYPQLLLQLADTVTAGSSGATQVAVATQGTYTANVSTTESNTTVAMKPGANNTQASATFRAFIDTATLAASRVAGSYVWTAILTPYNNATELTTSVATRDITITVAALASQSTVASAAYSKVWIGTSTGNSADAAVSAVATASDTPVGYLTVKLRNSQDNNAARESVTVSTNVGQVGTSTNRGRSVVLAYSTDMDVNIYADGTAGAATINISTPSITFVSKTATFYATAPKTITASVSNSALGAGANAGALSVKAVDANGIDWMGTLYVYSASTSVVSNDASSCSYNSANARHECSLTAVAPGTASIVVRDAATVAASTVTSTAVTVTATTAAAASATLAWDKASYVPGEKATLTVTVVDSTGKPVGAGTFANLYASGGISLTTAAGNGSASDLTTVSVTTAAPRASDPTKTVTTPVKTYTVYMPTNGGTITASFVGGVSLPIAAQGVKVSASATITDNAASALAAVNALATTVASLKTLITTLTNLVLKIQKKVKA